MGEVRKGGAPTALGKENAALIKRRMVEGYSNVQIAHLFGCSPETISRIRRGATHRDVRVLGDEVLERHLEREGVAGEARVQIARVDPVEELLKQAAPLTAEQERAAAATMGRLAALQAQQEAEEAARAAKEAGDERIAKELEEQGLGPMDWLDRQHRTNPAALEARNTEASARYDILTKGTEEEQRTLYKQDDETRKAAQTTPVVRTAAELEEIRRLQEGEL